MVLAESIRLYPPAWIVGRRAIGPFEVQGFTVPARSIVLLSQYVMHRDARWFPDPERFDPDRWTADEQAARPKFAYFPFGGGPRVRVAPQPIITLRPKHGMRMVAERRV